MKKTLRKKYLEIRNSIENRDKKNNGILKKVLENSYIKNSSLILVYVSFNNEVDTIELINKLINRKKIAVPKIENNEMSFYIISSLNELEIGTFNVLEPISKTKVVDFSNSCCIVPGICFNKNGYRIGYGKGYYDKFLKDYNGYSIGLTYDECLIELEFQDNYDIKVDKIISK